MASILDEKIKTYTSLRDDIIDDLNKSKEENDTDINEFDLDSESLRTPKLYNKYLNKYSDLSLQLNRLNDVRSKVYIERWKYYLGKQTSKYYADHGPFNEAINRTDVDIYLKSDDLLCLVDDCLHIMKQHLQYIERTMKEISNRGYHIKTAVEWRRFQSGS